MSTLNAFSEKERAYHAYQARQNYLREQSCSKRALERLETLEAAQEALQAENETLQAEKEALQEEKDAALAELARLRAQLAIPERESPRDAPAHRVDPRQRRRTAAAPASQPPRPGTRSPATVSRSVKFRTRRVEL